MSESNKRILKGIQMKRFLHFVREFIALIFLVFYLTGCYTANSSDVLKSSRSFSYSLTPELTEEVLAIIRNHRGNDMYIVPNIPNKKLVNAREANYVPADENILCLVNSTVWGGAKNSLLVGLHGIYVRNDWAGDSPGHHFVSYMELLNVVVGSKGWYEMSIGETNFNMSSCNMSRKTLVRMLREIQTVIKEDVLLQHTKFIQAVKNGDVQAVLSSLSSGADINIRDRENIPVLIWAANSGHVDIVKLLLDKGADVNEKEVNTGITALWIASQNGHADVVKLLLDKGADINVKRIDTETTALWMASQNGHTEVVKLLLDKSPEIDLEKPNTDGVTALWIASQDGHAEVVKLLLDRGVDVNVKKTDTGTSALWIASQNGHTDVVKLLLDKGVDINVKRIGTETTALWMASQNGHTDVVKLLLDKGAEVDLEKPNIGTSALWIALKNGHADVVKLLMKK